MELIHQHIYNNFENNYFVKLVHVPIYYSGYLNVNDTISLKLTVPEFTSNLGATSAGTISMNFANSFSSFQLYKNF